MESDHGHQVIGDSVLLDRRVYADGYGDHPDESQRQERNHHGEGEPLPDQFADGSIPFKRIAKVGHG